MPWTEMSRACYLMKMMHPDTRIEYLSETVGVGVVAKKAIAKGTWIWVRDPLDRILSPQEVDNLPQPVDQNSLTYMYRNHAGQYVLLWDHGKYVNHSFHANCMPTPYGLDIAIADIAPGEELTEDYGLLNIIEDFRPQAEGGEQDRQVVCGDDLKRHAESWDQKLKEALLASNQVQQALINLLSPEIKAELDQFWNGQVPMRSVSSMALSEATR